MADVQLKKRGYIWAISAGFNAALAAISAKFFSSLVIKYGLVVFCNVVMWGCYVNSLRALSSLQATVTNFAANFLSSGLAGLFLFQESLSFRWFTGALSITIGVLILNVKWMLMVLDASGIVAYILYNVEYIRRM